MDPRLFNRLGLLEKLGQGFVPSGGVVWMHLFEMPPLALDDEFWNSLHGLGDVGEQPRRLTPKV
jgi:hypothetical protein